MSLNDILNSLFPAGHSVNVSNHVIMGEATTAQGRVAVLGTTDAAAIDHSMALALSGFILDTVEKFPGRPLVFLVDTSGQALSRSQELLCLNGSLAHLASCVDLARRQGHRSISLVTANAVSGGYLSFGMMTDRAYALADAQVRVMDLRAMSRVTKIAHERLVELAGHSPIFAPGAESYVRMGGIEALWPEPSAKLLEQALYAETSGTTASDQRMHKALERGGRNLASDIASSVLNAQLSA
jgi:malonate decarboxylase gamma subunit